jgi:DNA-binding MarR family transcriptional regulator
VSQVVAQLIAKGFVTKTTDVTDGRRAVLRLTRSGYVLLRNAPRAVQEDLIDGFVALRVAERRALVQNLEKWLAAAGLDAGPASMLFERPAAKKTRPRSVRQQRLDR